MPCTPRHISDHIIYWPYCALHHISHRTTFSRQRCTEFHMPLHILHNCIIPRHMTVITPWSHPIPHPTTMFYIPHQYTTTFYIPPLTTSALWHWWWLWSVQSEVVTRQWRWLWSVLSESVNSIDLDLGSFLWLSLVTPGQWRGQARSEFHMHWKMTTLKLLIPDPPWPSWLRMVHVMVTMMVVVMVTSIFMIRPVVVMSRPAWWSR